MNNLLKTFSYLVCSLNAVFLFSCMHRVDCDSCKRYVEIGVNKVESVNVGDCFYGQPRLGGGVIQILRIDVDTVHAINTLDNKNVNFDVKNPDYVGFYAKEIDIDSQSAQIGQRVVFQY